MKLWIQTLIIWGGVVCTAWGSYESNDDQLLHARGKAFIHTVELLQQVKTTTAEPPTNNIPLKTVSFCLPDRAALPLAPYNLRCPVSATGEITRCCAIAFREPEKAKISSEMFLTCSTEGMPEAGSGKPWMLKGLQKEPIASLPPVVTLASRKIEADNLLSTSTFSLTASRESPAILANIIPTPCYEVRRNLIGAPLPGMKEIAITELNIVAFQGRQWLTNPILVSHHPDIGSIGIVDGISVGFKIHGTSPDAYFPELNEVIMAAKPVASGDNVSAPIKIICTDNIPGGSSENNSRAVPLRLNAKSVLDAASSALICVPALNLAALDNPASPANPILISCSSADTFALNKAKAAPICLNGLKTNDVLSVQTRQIIFSSILATTVDRSPCTLTLLQSDPTIPQTIDRMLISGIIDEVRSGRINKRNPEIRAQLVQFLGDNPFGPSSQQIFSMILEVFPGNALRRKIAALQAWAQEYAGGRYAPILGYYIMHQFYRNKDYDAALQFAESFLGKTKEYNDRVYFLQALCYAQKNNTAAARSVLQKIQHDYPDSPMAPESIFLYAWIFYEDGNLSEAHTILKELVAKYPNSASAVKAGNLLEAIKQKNSLATLKP